MLCPDTLGGAVLVTRHGVVKFVGAQGPTASTVAWVHVLHVMICEHGNRFAFEVHTRKCVGEYSFIQIAWSRWPPRGTRAHKAAAELHSQAAKWARSASFKQSTNERY